LIFVVAAAMHAHALVDIITRARAIVARGVAAWRWLRVLGCMQQQRSMNLAAAAACACLLQNGGRNLTPPVHHLTPPHVPRHHKPWAPSKSPAAISTNASPLLLPRTLNHPTHNAFAAIAAFCASLPGAAFVALDLELTGLTTSEFAQGSYADNLQSRYLKLRDSARNFAVTQLGVCVFRSVEGGGFEALPFCFHCSPCVAPGEGGKELRSKFLQNSDRRFMCQAESLKFVAQHGFDFNVWIKQGCSYLSRQEEAACMARIATEHAKKLNDGKDEMFNQEPRVFNELMTTVVADINRWVQSDDVQAVLLRGGAGIDAVKKVFARENVELSDDMPCFVTKEYDAYRRKIIYNEISTQFPDYLFETVDDDDAADNPRRRGKCMRVVYLGPPPAVQTAKLERTNAWLLKQQHSVASTVGVRRIIDAIAAARLPVVGHNCYLDLMHVYAKFVGDLPPRLGDWCCRLHEIFPAIFDTKHVLSGSQLRELVPDSTLDAAHFKLEDLAAAAAAAGVGQEAGEAGEGQSAAKARVFPAMTRAVLGADGAASASHEAGRHKTSNPNPKPQTPNLSTKCSSGHDAWMTGCVLVRALAAIDVRCDDCHVARVCRRVIVGTIAPKP